MLIFIPTAAFGQQGVVLYDRAIRYEFEVPERVREMRLEIPSADISSLILLFNEYESLLVPAPEEEEDEDEGDMAARELRMYAFASRLRMGSVSRSDQEDQLEVYVRYEDGAVTETREFMGRTFLISGTRPLYEWRLSAEQSQFLGYMVQKATTIIDSTHVEAWFTPEIPVAVGPGSFGGLPGMILSVSIDSGRSIYSATEINLTSVDSNAIKPPTEGQAVTQAEYELIVQEKLDELRLMRTNRRWRRP